MIADIDYASRDQWMRRTGPLYPLLVAFQMQTLLPVAPDLAPSDDDRERARPWLVVVGLTIGGALAAAAALLGAMLAPVAVAALVVVGAAVASGARLDVAAARAAGRPGARGAGTEAGVVALVLALGAGLLLRFAFLAGIDLAAWTGALIAAHVASRWAMMAALEAPAIWAARSGAGREERAGEEGPARPRWVPLAIATAFAGIAAGIAGRGAGLLALLLAAGVAFAAVRQTKKRDLPEEEAAAGAAALSEVVALFCFAWLAS